MANLRIDSKITKKRMQNHFAYAKWQYVVVIIAMVLGLELIFSVTAYRPPEDKVILTYLCVPTLVMDTDYNLREQTVPLFPEMEEIAFQHISIGSADDYYAQMQLSTYIGAREGDLFLMPRDRFREFADQGLFIPLDDYISSGIIDIEGMAGSRQILTLGAEATPLGESVTGVYGISAEELYGMLDLGFDNRNFVFGITAYSTNPEDAARMISWFVGEYKAPKPDWLIEAETLTTPDEVLPSY